MKYTSALLALMALAAPAFAQDNPNDMDNMDSDPINDMDTMVSMTMSSSMTAPTDMASSMMPSGASGVRSSAMMMGSMTPTMSGGAMATGSGSAGGMGGSSGSGGSASEGSASEGAAPVVNAGYKQYILGGAAMAALAAL
ncbi:MAG: hypothetical protein M1831_006094 [Alyxoria varia]|nr:MAG: hypothetical protein M1831_006094 [Alyxoria varia]